MEASDIKGRISIEQVLAHYGSPPSETGAFRCPVSGNHKNGDAKPSGKVFGHRAFCHSRQCFTEKGSDVFGVVGLLENLTRFPDQKTFLATTFGLTNGTPPTDTPASQPIKTNTQKTKVREYNYTDKAGALLFQAIRYEPKDFRQRQPNENGGWTWNLKGVEKVLYKLPEVDAAIFVLIVEGERDVETAYTLGLPDSFASTTAAMGAKKWLPEYSESLKDKMVWICPDQDEPGQEHGHQIAQALNGIAKGVLWVTLPDGHKDLSDWAEAGGTTEAFHGLLNNAKTPPAPTPKQKKTKKGDNQDDEAPSIPYLANAITDTHFFARDGNDRLFMYRDGVYRPDGERFVVSEVKRILLDEDRETKWSSHRALEVARYITVDRPLLWEKPPTNILNLANGLINIDTLTLTPHTHEHLSPIQLPINYDPEAKPDIWQGFLDDVLAEDTHHLLLEIILHLMTPDMRHQKAVLIYGPGANGKSTFLNGLTHFIGSWNIATISLHKLENDRFATARLEGKLVNIYADLPAQHIAGSSIFKALTGGDRLLGERKFSDSFEFQPFCRLVFSSNHYPICRDASPAFFRRWVVLPFDKEFTDSDPTRLEPDFLDAQLSSPEALSGLLNQVLSVLPALKKRGRFIDSETALQAWTEFRDQTDPLAQWLDLHTEEDPKAFIPRKDLTIKVQAWLEDHSKPAMDPKSILAGVRRLRPKVSEKRLDFGGERPRVFVGLKLTQEAENL